MGDIELDIPRDRRGEFEPQIVKKHQTGIVWEFVTPLFKTSSVADLYDFLCYVIGTMIYYGIKKIAIKL